MRAWAFLNSFGGVAAHLPSSLESPALQGLDCEAGLHHHLRPPYLISSDFCAYWLMELKYACLGVLECPMGL